jgi:hypothetical protein
MYVVCIIDMLSVSHTVTIENEVYINNVDINISSRYTTEDSYHFIDIMKRN